ncbi:carotenoid biosynthesis protein [candidate division KSB1 bacterium]|nr:MAG: carotenoid biosynthesis protein [candidate division KSB1 bacterium]
MSRREKIEIFVLYLLLVAGGLWHLLGVLGRLMRWSAAPILIGLALYLTWEMRLINRDRQKRLLLWGGIVLFGGFLVEAIGVKTGWIFGRYAYGEVLQPQLFGVPIAIGFAWLGIQISSLGLAQWVVKEKIGIYVLALLTAIFMVLFDLLMEPAAIYLGYWRWEEVLPPLQNYLSWFGIAMVFSMFGARLHLFHRQLPPFVFHSYIAQAIYFTLIFIRSVR